MQDSLSANVFCFSVFCSVSARNKCYTPACDSIGEPAGPAASDSQVRLRSEGEVSGQFELKTVRRSLQTTTACLIVDDKEITVGGIDVT